MMENPNHISEQNEDRKVSITKQELASLPIAKFPGNVVVVDNISQISAVAQDLKTQNIIGFDTETKPSFRRGQTNFVALLQLSTHTTCYLIRLNHLGMPEPIKEILENPDILKIGVSIHDDFHNMHKICDIHPEGFVELQTYVKNFEIQDNSLSRIYGILFGKRISKGQRLTNWEASELTPHQQEYAALDAYACIQIYEYLQKGEFNPSESPYYRVIEEPHPTQQESKSPDTTNQ